jgi:acyl carrier protein
MSKDFNALFAKILNLPVDQINDDLSPETSKTWDSLAMVDLIVAVEQQYKITFSHEDLMQFTSVGALRRLLESRGMNL